MLQNKIKNDLKIAIKNKDKEYISILKVIIGEFHRQFNKILKDYEVNFILRTLISNLETIGTIQAINEICIIEKYLPKYLSEEETINLVNNVIKNNNEEFNKHIYGEQSYFGFFMKNCMELHPNDLNYELLKIIVKNKLKK